MIRWRRIAWIALASLAGLALVAVIAALVVVQTDWFRNFVRQKIVATIEESTGGRVELRSFDFEPFALRATVRGLVVHGTEPASAPPLLTTEQVQVELKIFASLTKTVDIRGLFIDRPQVNLIVHPDGSTNIPSPKVKKKPSDKSGLETVVDLAIGRFELRNGLAVVSDRKTPFEARGENVSAQLFYQLAGSRYEGRISIDPLHARYADGQPLDLNITVPVTLEKDRIAFADAKIGTAESQLVLNGALENMNDPRLALRVNGHLSVNEARRFAQLPISPKAGSGLPGMLDVDLNAQMASGRIQVEGARLSLGQSNVEASGTLQDPSGKGSLALKGTIALGEAGRLFQVAARPEGTVTLEGNASLRGGLDYLLEGRVNGRDMSFVQDGKRIRNVNLYTPFHVDPHRIELSGMRLDAFGGQFAGNASVQDMDRFRLEGKLDHLDLRNAAGPFLSQPLPYDGVVSGPVQAEGSLKEKGTAGLRANVDLAIAPGARGTPVRGRLRAIYNGASDAVELKDSYIALPNTRLDLSGALGRQIQFKLTSRNLSDLVPAMAMGAKQPVKQLPVVLQSPATFAGTVVGTLSNPRLTGQLSMGGFLVEGRHFDSLAADVDASSARAALSNVLLARGPMRATADASLGLSKWKPGAGSPLKVNAAVRNGDLADVLALAGESSVPATGTLTAAAQIGGTYGNPTGGATLTVVNGSAYQEPLDRLEARVDFSNGLVSIPGAYVQSGAARVDLSARFQHPADSWSQGHLDLHLASNQVQLANLRNVLKQRPGLEGVLAVKADAAGDLKQEPGGSKFLLSRVDADFGVRGLRADGQAYGDLTGTARTSGNTVSYRVDSNFAKATIRVNGDTRLQPEYPTTASASIQNLPVERVLAVAGRGSTPVSGMLSGTGSFSGTILQPNANADLTLTKAVIYDEPLDQIRTRLSYSPARIDVPQLDVTAGSSAIHAAATFTHPVGDLENGDLTFAVRDSTVQLGALQNVRRLRPGLGGTLQLTAEGAGTMRAGQALLTRLDSDVNVNALSMNRTNLGDLRFTSRTRGDALTFQLASHLAQSQIEGSGQATLRGDYPMSAKLSFGNVAYSNLRPLLNQAAGENSDWDARLEGRVEVSGPARRPEALQGNLQLSRVQVLARTQPGAANKTVVIQNAEPVRLVLDRNVVRVESAHLTGNGTDARITGSAPLSGAQEMNVDVGAKVDLATIQQVSQSIYSSGAVSLQATVRGTITDPQVNGRLELRNASLNLIDLPNGISNANGTIVFNGNSASIQQLTAESGGGKVTLAGFVSRRGSLLTYNVRATGNQVRVRYPEGMSAVLNLNVNLTGTSQRSLLNGNVFLQSFGFSPRQDFGSMLSRTATPAKAPTAPQGPLAGMRLDVRIRTSSTATFVTSLAQNIQADADLSLRGTLASPGLVGRINITEAQMVFFGTQYTVTQGTVAFYDPYRILPVLNVDLETVAKGVNVTLNVSGPIDNLRLTHTSDPPLQFSEVLALLAAGRTPTSDPNLVARQPATPPQTFQQMGESAVLSQAVANPVSSRLERVFGVNKLKIDPTFTSGSELPQARLTLQQQITSNLTFTYVTNLTQTNSQIVRVEWALNDSWSAVATRDENGLFGIDFFYKKQFR